MWGSQQAIADIAATGTVSFDVQVEWSDDTCGRQPAMKNFISQLSAPLQTGESSFHGVIGSGCSSACGGLAELSPLWGIPVLSWGCSSPALSDSAQYPYFSRTSLSGAFHTKGWVLVARYFQWRRMASLCEREDGAVFTSAQSGLEEWMLTNVPEVEMVLTLYFKTSSPLEVLRSAAREIALAGVRVIAFNSYEASTTAGLCAFQQEGFVGTQWVLMTYGWFPQGWVSSSAPGSGCTAEELLPLARGILGSTDLTWAMDATLATPSGKSPPELKQEYYDYMSASQPNDTPNDFVAMVYDATWAWALAMNAYVQENPSFFANFDHTSANEASPYLGAIHAKILEQDFVGASGRVQFDSNGDRMGGLEVRQYDGSSYILKGTCTVQSCLFTDAIDFRLEAAWDPAEPSIMQGRVPSGEPPACSVGFSLDILSNTCEECPVGKVFMAQGAMCLCQSGYNVSAADPNACTPCPRGSFGGSVGLAGACSVCPAGAFSDSLGASSCERCSQGTYQSAQASTECIPCGENRNTLVMAAERAEECKCSAGFFLRSVGGTCEPCPLGMTCPFGSEMDNYQSWQANGRPAGAPPFPELLPSYMSLADEPLSVYKCKESTRCPGGPPGTCGPELDASIRSCAHCQDRMYWSGDSCEECTHFEASSVLFPVIPILITPAIICALYRISRDDSDKWGSWENSLSTITFIVLNHYQVTSLMANSDLEYPGHVMNYFNRAAVTGDPSVLFKPECAGFQDFSTMIVMRSLGPIFIAVLTAGTFLASKAMQRITMKEVGFDVNRTLNVYFGVIFMFFAGISAMALSLFKCAPNPNGNRTLLQDPSIICGAGEWTSMLVVAILAVLLYIVAFGGVFLRVIIIAPARFSDLAFRRRWKFLFIKFRPDAWWWAAVVVTKGVLMNLGNTFLSTGVGQTYWIMMTTGVYAFGLVFFMPWRHMYGSFLEAYTSLALIFLGSLASLYVHGTPLDWEVESSWVALAIVLLNLSPLVFAGILLAHMFWQRKVSASQQRRVQQVQELVPGMRQFMQAEDSNIIDFMERIDEWSRFHIILAFHVVNTEFKGKMVKRRLSDGGNRTSAWARSLNAVQRDYV